VTPSNTFRRPPKPRLIARLSLHSGVDCPADLQLEKVIAPIALTIKLDVEISMVEHGMFPTTVTLPTREWKRDGNGVA
jgi:hypothetical protein